MTIRATDQRYQDMCKRVATFKDALGLQVDPGIFDTVVVLNLMAISTHQSCEGHLDHGLPYPWVNVVDEETAHMFNRRWVHVCDLEEQAKETRSEDAYDRYLAADAQLRIVVTRVEQDSSFYRRLTSLLDTFYNHSVTPRPERLFLKRFKSAGMYRIEPCFAEVAEEIPVHLKASYLERGQAEMTAFTAFLMRQVME